MRVLRRLRGGLRCAGVRRRVECPVDVVCGRGEQVKGDEWGRKACELGQDKGLNSALLFLVYAKPDWVLFKIHISASELTHNLHLLNTHDYEDE